MSERSEITLAHREWTRLNQLLRYPKRGLDVVRNPAKLVQQPEMEELSYSNEVVNEWTRQPALDGYCGWMEAFKTLDPTIKPADYRKITHTINVVHAIQADFFSKSAAPKDHEINQEVERLFIALQHYGAVYFPTGRYPSYNVVGVQEVGNGYQYTEYYLDHDPVTIGGQSNAPGAKQEIVVQVKHVRPVKNDEGQDNALKAVFRKQIELLHKNKARTNEDTRHEGLEDDLDEQKTVSRILSSQPGSKQTAVLGKQGTIAGATCLIEDLLGEELSGRLDSFIHSNHRDDIDRQFRQRVQQGSAIRPANFITGQSGAAHRR